MYDIPYEDVTKQQRTDNKPAVLGCGFMLSGGSEVGVYPIVKKTGLWAYAESMGIHISREKAHEQVAGYRALYSEVAEMWPALEEAMMTCILTQKPVRLWPVEFDIQAPFLRMLLPSGRYIYYLRPRIGDHVIKHPGGEFVKRGVSYEGKNKIGKWTRVNTHGGKLVENICQAVARDILTDGLLAADADGFDIVLHVHDEIGAQVDEFDDYHTPERLSEVMSIVPEWATGLLLKAEGFKTPFYWKQ